MMLVRMPNTRSGIIVRIDRVATTRIDAKELLAAPACSAGCEVFIGSQPILRTECLRDRCSARPHRNVRAGPLIYGQNDVFSGILAQPDQGNALPRPALQSSMNRTATGTAGRTTPRCRPAITLSSHRVDDLAPLGHFVGPVTRRLTVSGAFKRQALPPDDHAAC